MITTLKKNTQILIEVDKNPNNLLAPLIPGKSNTYIYDDEDSYYEMYKKSIFALTYKKAGWDCLRHYEILMNGCIPLFLDIQNCPEGTITTLPKDKFIKINNDFNKVFDFYNPFKIFKKKYLTLKKIFSFISFKSKNEGMEYFLNNKEQILNLKKELVDFTKKNLTTEELAKYTLTNFEKYK